MMKGDVGVKRIKGEGGIKGDGKLVVIEGGLWKGYEGERGIGGYRVVYEWEGMELVEDEGLERGEKVIEEGEDMKWRSLVIELKWEGMMVKDRDKGKEVVREIEDLKKLVVGYRRGFMKEKEIL